MGVIAYDLLHMFCSFYLTAAVVRRAVGVVINRLIMFGGGGSCGPDPLIDTQLRLRILMGAGVYHAVDQISLGKLCLKSDSSPARRPRVMKYNCVSFILMAWRWI